MSMIESYKLKNWDDIKNTYKDGQLILGNGASIAYDDCFKYNNLSDKILENFSGENKELWQERFNEYNGNVEDVLSDIITADEICKNLNVEVPEIDEIYQKIQNSFINSLGVNHASEHDIKGCAKNFIEFYSSFKSIISLNYDLVLSWMIYYDSVENSQYKFLDGFDSRFSFKRDILVLDFSQNPCKKVLKKEQCKCLKFRRESLCKNEKTPVFYLHGNLLLAVKEEYNIMTCVKLVNVGTNIKTAMDKWIKYDIKPLFITEGSNEKKMAKISTNDYLNFVYEDVLASSDKLVFFGFSFNENDRHIVEKIKASDCKKIAVSCKDKKGKLFDKFASDVTGKFLGSHIKIEFYNADSIFQN